MISKFQHRNIIFGVQCDQGQNAWDIYYNNKNVTHFKDFQRSKRVFETSCMWVE